MNPDELAALVHKQRAERDRESRESKQKEEAEERSRQEAKARERAGAKRYVTLEEKEDGSSHLTYHCTGKRGVAKIMFPFIGVILLLSFEVLPMILGAPLLALGIYYYRHPRTKIRVMLANSNFAIFVGDSLAPRCYGAKSELSFRWVTPNSVTQYGLKIDSPGGPSWRTLSVMGLIEGIEHPEDVALLQAFHQKLGTGTR